MAYQTYGFISVRRIVTCGVALAAVLTVGSQGPTAYAGAGDDFYHSFSSGQPLGYAYPSTHVFGNQGTQSGITSTVVYSDGGVLTNAPGFVPTARAIRTPAFSTGTPTPFAVVKVTNTGATDLLNPGVKAFKWGADYKLDTVSSGLGTDNGDNLIQRGLFNSGSQYKLQIDGGKPSCTIRGTAVGGNAASLEVLAPNPVPRGEWRTVLCQRLVTGNTNKLKITIINRATGAQETKFSAVANNPIDLGNTAKTVPLSVGGKLNATGTPVRSATDQFNGLIDNPRLDIS